ncbi:hypothetical protein T06_11013 [Trichinella sp. T6]|nr:hypothetical protein T06_11013 [Trichinella sp. T6]
MNVPECMKLVTENSKAERQLLLPNRSTSAVQQRPTTRVAEKRSVCDHTACSSLQPMHSSHIEFEYTVNYSSAVHWLLHGTVLSHSSGSARAGLSASSASDSNTLDQPNKRRQSQSLFRSYGSVLPTSLTYIILSARGYSPWRPAADISTTKYEIYQASLGFSRTDESAPNTVKKSAFYGYQNPYLRTTRFQGMRPLKRKENSFRNSRRSFSEFACVTARLS